MKIGMVAAALSRSGGGIHEVVRRSALELHRRGSSVSVFGLDDEHFAQDRDAWLPVPVSVFRNRGYKPFAYAPDLLPALRSAAPDILHNHGLWMYPSVASYRWSKLMRRPYIISTHGMLDPWAVKHSYWKKRFAGVMYEHRHLMNAACLHALCPAEADAIRRYGLTNPVCVVPCGIDLPALGPTKSTRQEKVLLFLGRIHPKKGLVHLLTAWKLLQRDGASAAVGWKLWIAGWDQGNHEADLHRWCTEQDLHCSVRFVGPKFGTEKDSVLRSADAFVLPSFSEGLPVSVLEAWAYGLPVAMTTHCNLPQGFAVGAAVCIDTTAPSIARGLLDVMAMTDEERSVMGIRGRRLVEEQFSWASYAKQMYSVYSWMSRSEARPGCVSLV
jgi:glycosyltransferase involved in cell wall biosynthesis